jgi:hypothetical protein
MPFRFRFRDYTGNVLLLATGITTSELATILGAWIKRSDVRYSLADVWNERRSVPNSYGEFVEVGMSRSYGVPVTGPRK